MKTHICCRGCRFEAVVFNMDADRTVNTHEAETGHTVDSEEFDGEKKLVADGGPEVRTVQIGQVEVEVHPDDTVTDLYDRTNGPLEVTAVNTVLCRPFGSSGRVPDEEDYVSYDLEDVEDGDELELYRLPVSERPAYEEALRADGGRPTLRLTDHGLQIPEDVNLSGGVVFRARGITTDHKPGTEDRPVYPALQQRHLTADGRKVVNEHLDEDEVSVKQYGHDAQTYKVVIPETDGGWGEPEKRARLLEQLREEVSASGLLRCKARRIAQNTEFDTQTVGKYLSRFATEDASEGVDVSVFHNGGRATIYEIETVDAVATAGGDD